MAFEAVKQVKVQVTDPDGSIRTVVRMPGEEIPEAASWRDPKKWIQSGHIRVKPGTTEDLERRPYVPAHASTREDIRRSESADIIKNGQPLPENSFEPVTVRPAMPPKPAPAPVPPASSTEPPSEETPAAAPSGDPRLDKLRGQLEGLTDPKLREVAKELGIANYSRMKRSELVTLILQYEEATQPATQG